MLPENDGLNNDFEIVEQPSHTIKLNLDTYRWDGFIDDIESVKQVVYTILYTERYDYIIHTWNYGIELKDLFGKPKSFVIPELERVIRESLMQDDRILDVKDFKFESNLGNITCTFTVNSKFGQFKDKFEGVDNIVQDSKLR